ncbi:hypothetical protein ASPBRDRAFT_644074 [Aspergillus brasiliensis CBS 101740]|uniref:Uncharacterized protein n=1 Tax=Aspergillus brasiliensis (strain CBS 101740 / IMI 381727 / IBT 21946) TaxID=767769 RepID=A0A1L9UE22_ASPBC|nr:hypothetical protein ASPBRDRAFT_644074 [Aspergillus brasiliensis CBS 101740]
MNSRLLLFSFLKSSERPYKITPGSFSVLYSCSELILTSQLTVPPCCVRGLKTSGNGRKGMP